MIVYQVIKNLFLMKKICGRLSFIFAILDIVTQKKEKTKEKKQIHIYLAIDFLIYLLECKHQFVGSIYYNIIKHYIFLQILSKNSNQSFSIVLFFMVRIRHLWISMCIFFIPKLGSLLHQRYSIKSCSEHTIYILLNNI